MRVAEPGPYAGIAGGSPYVVARRAHDVPAPGRRRVLDDPGGGAGVGGAATAYLREHTRTEVADEAWRRVVAAVPAADSPGMRHQFVCHVQFAASKDAWYLEPARPDVGYARTVAAGCNPGSPRDVG